MTAPKIVPPPMPKYWIDEHVIFLRSNEEQKVDKITCVDIVFQDTCGEWEVRYYMQDTDDKVDEEEILGPVTLGKKR